MSKLYLDFIIPKICLSNWLSPEETLVYVYHKVHENFHQRFAMFSHKDCERYMEISMYLATKFAARYMEISVYLAISLVARYMEISINLVMWFVARYMEISMYLATNFVARYMEISMYLARCLVKGKKDRLPQLQSSSCFMPRESYLLHPFDQKWTFRLTTLLS